MFLPDTFVKIDGADPVPCELTITTENIEVRAAQEASPDHRWEHWDSNGHYHAWTSSEKLPTLTRQEVPQPCDGSCGGFCNGEGYTATEWRCRLCDELVDPGCIIRQDVHKSIPGTTSWEVTATVESPGRDFVSLHIVAGKRTYFGHARAGGFLVDHNGIKVTFHGIAELGQRKA